MGLEPALRGQTALLVEDEVLVSMLAEEVLEEAGCAVLVAMRLDRALELARDAQISCAILDVNLGNESTSYPVAEVLCNRGIPFIFVSGYGAIGINNRFASFPMVQKPYTPDVLIDAVQSCLRSPAP
jgi:DNA-binding response OmpR family regulator